MRNRHYDPLTGRFTQEDPIGLAGGLNLYGFANGDPVNFSDPFGDSTFVNCRATQTGHARFDATFAHCAIRVRNAKLNVDKTIQMVPLSGMTWKVGYSGPADSKTTDFTRPWVSVNTPEGLTTDELDKRVLLAADFFDELTKNGEATYNPLGSGNSNHFVYAVITLAGGRVPSAAQEGLGRDAAGVCGGSWFWPGSDCSH